MRRLVVSVLFLLLVQSAAPGAVKNEEPDADGVPAGSILKNGDLSEGRKGWFGHFTVVSLDGAKEKGNPCMAIEMHKKRDRDVSQSIKLPKGQRTFDVTLRIKCGKAEKSDAFVPGVMTLRCYPRAEKGKDKPKGLRKKNVYVELSDEWKTFSWDLKNLSGDESKWLLELVIGPGDGIVYVDDVAMVPK